MSIDVKNTPPNRCYCQIQDKEVNLNNIAKIFATTNLKILQLQNDVNVLKNVDFNRENKLFQNTKTVCEHLPSCSKCYTPQSNVKFDQSAGLEKSKVLTDFFENNFTNEICNYATHLNDVFINEKLQITDYNTVSADVQENRKTICKEVQCDFIMERKRKRTFLNCFKPDWHKKKPDSLKPNKKMKLSSKTNNIHVTFNPNTEEAKLTKIGEQKNNQISKLETYTHDEDNLARVKTNQICKLTKVESKKELFQESKINDNELAEYNMKIPKTAEDERKSFEYSISRMGGGAEIRGNNLMSDFHDTIKKINLYKNVKFDAKNVKKRLDACIAELNGIIEDISLIFPNSNISKKLQK